MSEIPEEEPPPYTEVAAHGNVSVDEGAGVPQIRQFEVQTTRPSVSSQGSQEPHINASTSAMASQASQAPPPTTFQSDSRPHTPQLPGAQGSSSQLSQGLGASGLGSQGSGSQAFAHPPSSQFLSPSGKPSISVSPSQHRPPAGPPPGSSSQHAPPSGPPPSHAPPPGPPPQHAPPSRPPPGHPDYKASLRPPAAPPRPSSAGSSHSYTSAHSQASHHSQNSSHASSHSSRPSSDYHFHAPMPGPPPPPQGRPQLRYPPNYFCKKCHNTGIKIKKGTTCQDCFERFGVRGQAQYLPPGVMPVFNAPPRVVMPGDPSIGGWLCGRCRGSGITRDMLVFEQTCPVCHGVGRVF